MEDSDGSPQTSASDTGPAVIRQLFAHGLDISGLRWLLTRFYPTANPFNSPVTEPPLGFIWLLSAYVALFGIASQRYENRIDRLEARVNTIAAQSALAQNSSLQAVPAAQARLVPSRPALFDPGAVFASLFGALEPDLDSRDLLAEIVVSKKANLRDLDLDGLWVNEKDLRGADFYRAHLRGAQMSGAKLDDASLVLTTLAESKLNDAKLRRADLRDADLSDADLSGADFTRANLEGANLEGALIDGAGFLGAILSEATWVDGTQCSPGSIGRCEPAKRRSGSAGVPDDAVRVRVIDTGAGLAIVIRIPAEPADKFVVYDTGGLETRSIIGRRITELVPEGEDIDLLVISHGDVDHTAGLSRLLDEYPVQTILRTGQSRTYQKLWSRTNDAVREQNRDRRINDINLRYNPLSPGFSFDFGEAKLTLLSGFYKVPHEWKIEREGDARNAGSIVLRLEYAGKSLLLPGDILGRDPRASDGPLAPIAAERFLVEHQDKRPLRSDVLIAPYHGSNRASSSAFIEAVDPKWVVFSSGHKHKHPRAAVAERYLDAGVSIEQMFRTDLCDDEGGSGESAEWAHGRKQGEKDPAGDDDVEIVLPRLGEIEVFYVNPDAAGCLDEEGLEKPGEV